MIFILFFLLASVQLVCAPAKALVSVAPYVEIVRDLTGDAVQVELLVPAGFSSHTYEPTPKQVISSLDARIWFIIGELFEKKMEVVLKEENPSLLIVDLRKNLSLLHETHCCHDHDHISDADPHIWTSPKMMMTQVQTMAEGLQLCFPEQKEAIQKHLAATLAKLEALDCDIASILKDKKGAHIYVSHPAYGYFCREFGLVQVPVEFEGKDPTPRQITELLQRATKEKVHTIFIQKQYSTKAAQLIAEEIDAKLVLLDPYAEDYYSTMRKIAEAFRDGAAS